MKIVYLSSSTIPSRAANSVHVMKMCQAFAANGHEVTLLARRPSTTHIANDYDHYGVTPSFNILKCPPPPAPFLSQFWIFYDMLWVRRQVACMSSPDLLYARRIYNLAALAPLRIPMILELHDLPHHRALKSLIGWLIRQPHFARLIVISAALRDAFREIYPYLPPDKLLVAHDGADELPIKMAAVSLRLPGRPGAFRVGYVGHLYPGRGIDVIIALAGQLPDIDFHIVGGDEADIQHWQNQYRGDNLFFHGYTPPKAVSQYTSQFDVVLAPYQRKVLGVGRDRDTARWMSPLKIFEYMAAGKALVCTDLAPLREVLRHRENALLCPPDDTMAWVKAVSELKADADLRIRLGKQALQQFQAHYTWQKRAESVLAGL
jgi:glycosyltransferase involved in cell wall biosynthesis